MSSSNSGGARRSPSWAWRRWIAAGEADRWIERVQQLGCTSWAVIEKPTRVRLLLTAFGSRKAEALRLQAKLGGQVRRVPLEAWMGSQASPPLRLGRRLEIVHEEAVNRGRHEIPRLHLPHGMAFGSGEHATTLMLLRGLTRLEGLDRRVVLDVGTGSGVLALAARLFGARKIVGTDWDAEAIRTARQNEVRNFRTTAIRWQQADVRRLRASGRYDLVLANLFSGILCEAATRLAQAVSAGGQLWLSGILRAQQEEVVAAFHREGLELVHAGHRGKWVMLQWQRGGRA